MKNSDVDAVAFIEEEYPETATEFKRIQKEQYELFCKKQMDYGPSNIAMGTGVGEAVKDILIDEECHITSFKFTNQSKAQLVSTLVAEI